MTSNAEGRSSCEPFCEPCVRGDPNLPMNFSRALRLAAVLLPLIVLVTSGSPVYAATGVDWTTASQSISGGFRAIAYGAGRFVAVGDGGIVMTSDNGLDWTSRTAAASNNWKGVTYGAGQFVAVSNNGTGNRVMTSPDGITWTSRTPASEIGWKSVTYGNGKFVAVALASADTINGADRVMTSADGITWTTQAPSVLNGWQSVTYGNGTFVAVASSVGKVGVMTSPDGVTWTSRTAAADNLWNSVTYGNNLFVAVSNTRPGNVVMTSPDGITWTSRTSASQNLWFGVTYGAGKFVAVGGAGASTRVMTSPDGINWTNQTEATASDWNGVAYGSGRFIALTATSSAKAMYSGSDCGDGLGYTVNQWRQVALPCGPTANPASVASVFGNSPTANLPASSYATDWTMYGRTTANNGNTNLPSTRALETGAGYWLKSATAPVNGTLKVDGAAATLTTGLTGCQSLVGCVVLGVNTSAAGTRMFGNPFGYDVAWSDVRIQVGSTVYTPSEANTAGYISKQIWIWNGSSYDTWDDSTTPGNLKYGQGFFIKVLSGGVGQTISLLVPATSSTITVTSLSGRLRDGILNASRTVADAISGALVSPAFADEVPKGWRVKLRAENPAKAAKAQAVLGQFPGAGLNYDTADLNAMAPFAAPYLVMVFPHPDWTSGAGDYATDFRAFDNKPGSWLVELRADTAGQKVNLRWEGDPAILKRSVLIDKIGAKTINPTDPNYVNGYTLTLNSPTRQLVWQYLGP